MKINIPKLKIAPIDLSTVSRMARRPGNDLTILNILSNLKPLSTTNDGPIFKKSSMEKVFTKVSKTLNPSYTNFLGPNAKNLIKDSAMKTNEKTSLEMSWASSNH